MLMPCSLVVSNFLVCESGASRKTTKELSGWSRTGCCRARRRRTRSCRRRRARSACLALAPPRPPRPACPLRRQRPPARLLPAVGAQHACQRCHEGRLCKSAVFASVGLLRAHRAHLTPATVFFTKAGLRAAPFQYQPRSYLQQGHAVEAAAGVKRDQRAFRDCQLREQRRGEYQAHCRAGWVPPGCVLGNRQRRRILQRPQLVKSCVESSAAGCTTGHHSRTVLKPQFAARLQLLQPSQLHRSSTKRCAVHRHHRQARHRPHWPLEYETVVRHPSQAA